MHVLFVPTAWPAWRACAAKDFLFAGSLTAVLLIGAVVTVLLAVAVPELRDTLVQRGAAVVLRL